MFELRNDEALKKVAMNATNNEENVRLAFDEKVDKPFENLCDTNFKFYQHVTDHGFRSKIMDALFERFRLTVR